MTHFSLILKSQVSTNLCKRRRNHELHFLVLYLYKFHRRHFVVREDGAVKFLALTLSIRLNVGNRQCHCNVSVDQRPFTFSTKCHDFFFLRHVQPCHLRN